MPAETLVAIDGHYYAYKFFFGMPPLTGPGGRPTGVTYAFADLVRNLRQNPLLTHLVCVFDIGDSFRSQIFAEYKAHRDPMPDLLAAQLDDVEEILRASGVPILKIPGYEADDVLATLAKQACAAGMNVRLCTKDKDIDQLLNHCIRTWDPGKDVLRGPKELLEEKGITPEQVIDYLCMIGDSADNVPGITGVGPKTATKLLQQYGNLAAVLANSDQLKGKQRENVEAFKAKAELTCRLIQLADVPDLPPLDTFRIDRAFRGDEAAFAKFNFSRARFFPAQAQPASTADAPYRVLSLADLPAFIADARKAGRFAFDTETTGLDPLTADLVGISMACGIPDARAAVYLPLRGLDHALVPWDAAKNLLAPLFADASIKKVGQNTKYDVRVLARHGLTVNGIDGDTMLASWLLDPGRESHGIDHLTRSFLGEEKIATGQVVDLTNGQTMADVPVVNVAKYACEDAQCCWRLAQLLETKLADNNLLAVYRTQEVPIAGCLGRMEDAGLLVNRETLAATQRHLEQYLTEVTASIRKHAGGSFNPASPKQVAELLFTKLGLPVMSQTKSGPSTDASVLEALRHLHELPDLLLQHRMLSKLIGTYLTKLPEYISADGRIHTNLKQTGAETGRLASDSPNLQNIPKKSDLGREIRAAFVPGPGRVFLAADYSQIELRVLAHLSGDPTLKQAFASGADIHRFVAAQVAGIDEAAVTPKQRNAAKAVNFGIIYGQTAFGLSQQLGIPRGEAQKFIDGYFARFSLVKAYIASVIEQSVQRGYAETIAGRRRYVPNLASGNRNERLQGERIALNSTIQGSAADLIKRAMLRCEAMLPAGARLILQIHDELLVEADATAADAAAAALREAMTGAWTLDVALIAEVRRGDTWFAVS
jgi:DNA polymerase I